MLHVFVLLHGHAVRAIAFVNVISNSQDHSVYVLGFMRLSANGPMRQHALTQHEILLVIAMQQRSTTDDCNAAEKHKWQSE